MHERAIAPRALADSGGVPWASTVGYSQAVEVAGALLFISGQGAFDDAGELTFLDDAEGQIRRTFANLNVVLQHNNLTLANVIHQTVYLAEAADFDAFKMVRSEFFSEPFPAALTVGAQLLVPGMLVEISAIASRDVILKNRES